MKIKKTIRDKREPYKDKEIDVKYNTTAALRLSEFTDLR